MSVKNVYIRMSQGPQIFSTPTVYLDLSNVPLQRSHREVYDNKRRVILDQWRYLSCNPKCYPDCICKEKMCGPECGC
jgi:hypothetical protein